MHPISLLLAEVHLSLGFGIYPEEFPHRYFRVAKQFSVGVRRFQIGRVLSLIVLSIPKTLVKMIF